MRGRHLFLPKRITLFSEKITEKTAHCQKLLPAAAGTGTIENEKLCSGRAAERRAPLPDKNGGRSHEKYLFWSG
ncbi:MAG: hypothetical protein IJ412_10705 [Oscillospiraceae bacterium]|nr:hypothetical protein [Oscillospiraceae bacterium]